MKVSQVVQSEAVKKQVEGKGAAKSDGSFNRILEESLSDGAKTQRAEKGGTENIMASPIACVPFIDALRGLSDVPGIAGTTIADTLDRLNTVEQELLSGSPSADQLREAIGAISSEAEKLQESARSLPDDHPLKQIANELSVLANVETIKWNRGDYM